MFTLGTNELIATVVVCLAATVLVFAPGGDVQGRDLIALFTAVLGYVFGAARSTRREFNGAASREAERMIRENRGGPEGGRR